MVKQWVQPQLIKIDCHLEVFYQGPISQVLFFIFIIRVFHWNIRGALIQNTP